MPIVHILRAGVAVCGKPGLPEDWETDHYGVEVKDARDSEINLVTCDECRRRIQNQQGE